MSRDVEAREGDREINYELTLFKGIKFYIGKSVPSKDRWVGLIKENGGKIVLMDKYADVYIDDYLHKRGAPPEAVSWKWIEGCIKTDKLLDVTQYKIHKPAQQVSSTATTSRTVPRSAPRKRERTPFTPEDDHILIRWCLEKERIGDRLSGNKIYQELAEQNTRHTWQSWRNRWVNKWDGVPRDQLPGASDVPPSTFNQETRPRADRRTVPEPERAIVRAGPRPTRLERDQSTLTLTRDRYEDNEVDIRPDNTPAPPTLPVSSQPLHTSRPPPSQRPTAIVHESSHGRVSSKELVEARTGQLVKIIRRQEELDDELKERRRRELEENREEEKRERELNERKAQEIDEKLAARHAAAEAILARRRVMGGMLLEMVEMEKDAVRGKSEAEDTMVHFDSPPPGATRPQTPETSPRLESLAPQPTAPQPSTPGPESRAAAPRAAEPHVPEPSAPEPLASQPVKTYTPKEQFFRDLLAYQEHKAGREHKEFKPVPWLTISKKCLDLWDVWQAVQSQGCAPDFRNWEDICDNLGLNWVEIPEVTIQLKEAYDKHLGEFEQLLAQFDDEDESSSDQDSQVDSHFGEEREPDADGIEFASSRPVNGLKRTFEQAMLPSETGLSRAPSKRRRSGAKEDATLPSGKVNGRTARVTPQPHSSPQLLPHVGERQGKTFEPETQYVSYVNHGDDDEPQDGDSQISPSQQLRSECESRLESSPVKAPAASRKRKKYSPRNSPVPERPSQDPEDSQFLPVRDRPASQRKPVAAPASTVTAPNNTMTGSPPFQGRATSASAHSTSVLKAARRTLPKTWRKSPALLEASAPPSPSPPPPPPPHSQPAAAKKVPSSSAPIKLSSSSTRNVAHKYRLPSMQDVIQAELRQKMKMMASSSAPVVAPTRAVQPTTTSRGGSSTGGVREVIDNYVSLGYPARIAARALKATSMVPGREAAYLMERLSEGKKIPDDQPGIWTDQDDEALKMIDSVDFSEKIPLHDDKALAQRNKARVELKRLRDKHGDAGVQARRAFLRRFPT